MVQCDFITTPKPAYNWHSRGGGQCSRQAKYTDGEHFYCTQHAREFSTPLKRATKNLRPGMRLIEAKP